MVSAGAWLSPIPEEALDHTDHSVAPAPGSQCFLSVFGCQLLEEERTAVSHHSQCSLSSPLRSLRAPFHGDYANLHPLQWCTGLPCAPYPRQRLLSLAFLITALLIVVGCYLGVVLMLISLKIGDIEYLFMNVLAVCTSSLEKCLFRSFAYF